MNDVKSGFEETMKHSESYLNDARDAVEKLPDSFSHRKFLEFLFLTVEHYNLFWYKKLQEELEAAMGRMNVTKGLEDGRARQKALEEERDAQIKKAAAFREKQKENRAKSSVRDQLKEDLEKGREKREEMNKEAEQEAKEA